jgi:hypothetical protein
VSDVVSRRRIHYPPPSLRCPHCRSGARRLFYHCAYRTRDGPRLLWQCRKCRRCLSERRGTAFFNLKTPEREVASCLDSLTRGDSQTSVAQSRRHKRDTLRRWRGRAAHSARAVDAGLVTDLRVRDLELDEQWSFAGCKQAPFADSSERGEVWWHKAMARESRLLVEQFICARTPEAVRRLVNQSFDCLASGSLPRVSSDGYDAYTQPLSEQDKAITLYPLQWALMKGKCGRPPKPKTIPDPALVYGQVVKTREGRRIVKVESGWCWGHPRPG